MSYFNHPIHIYHKSQSISLNDKKMEGVILAFAVVIALREKSVHSKRPFCPTCLTYKEASLLEIVLIERQ